jgi:hypothetical protein
MNIEFLNQLKPQERDKGRRKKKRGDEAIWVIMHTYLHGNVTRKLPMKRPQTHKNVIFLTGPT